MMKRHFTVTCYLIEKTRVLLLFHPKYKKWLPPGGHLMENETPIEGLMREVLEETGLLLELLQEEHIWIEEPNAVSLARPYFCLLERSPPHLDQEEHEHIDLIYVGRPIGGVLLQDPLLRWFTLEEVMALPNGKIFLDTQKTIQHLLHRAEYLSVIEPSQTSASKTST